MHTIHSLVNWFCSQLTKNELLSAISLLLDVYQGRRDDIKLKRQFREEHPNYRDYEVDTEPPLTEPPEAQPRTATLDWRELVSRHTVENGRVPAPVTRRNGYVPPAGSRCERTYNAFRRILQLYAPPRRVEGKGAYTLVEAGGCRHSPGQVAETALNSRLTSLPSCQRAATHRKKKDFLSFFR